jgi:universal stress protein A
MSVDQRNFRAMKTKQIRNWSRLNGHRRLGATPRRTCELSTMVDLTLSPNTISGFGTSHTRPQQSRPRNNCRISPSRILVPIDFCAESRRALEYASAFASHFRACITLLHVVAPIACEADYGYGLVIRRVPNQELLKKAKRRLERVRKNLLGAELKVAILVRTGLSHSEIIQTAKDSEIDLIIMGTQDDSKSGQTQTGSTAEKVVRHAPCPVLVVKQKEQEFVV